MGILTTKLSITHDADSHRLPSWPKGEDAPQLKWSKRSMATKITFGQM